MLGLVVAALIFVIPFTFGSGFETSFVRMSGFLFWWYIVVSILKGILIGLFSILLPLFGSSIGCLTRQIGNPIGVWVSGLMGGPMSPKMLLLFVISQIFFVAGAYCLKSGLVLNGSSYDWYTGNIVLGVILLGLGLLSQPGRDE